MTTPTPSLSDRASAAYAHAREISTLVRHWLFTGAGVALLVAATVGACAVRDSIVGQHQRQAAEKSDAGKPHDVPPAKLETSLFGPDEHELARNTPGQPRPATTGRGGKPGKPVAEPPLPSTPEPDPTPAIPHPEVTTRAAIAGPVATTFLPETALESDKIAKKYGIDLGRYFPVTQRLELGPMPDGVDVMGFITAGGGDVALKYVKHERPKIGFPRLFALGGGVKGRGGDIQQASGTPSPTAWGAAARARYEPIRFGNWFVSLEGGGHYYPTLEHPGGWEFAGWLERRWKGGKKDPE